MTNYYTVRVDVTFWADILAEDKGQAEDAALSQVAFGLTTADLDHTWGIQEAKVVDE